MGGLKDRAHGAFAEWPFDSIFLVQNGARQGLQPCVQGPKHLLQTGVPQERDRAERSRNLLTVDITDGGDAFPSGTLQEISLGWVGNKRVLNLPAKPGFPGTLATGVVC